MRVFTAGRAIISHLLNIYIDRSSWPVVLACYHLRHSLEELWLAHVVPTWPQYWW